MMVLINPGTGPVSGATEQQARDNMQEFLAELGLGEDVSAECNGPALDTRHRPDGRWAFTVQMPGGVSAAEVDMPGIPGLSESAKAAKIHPRLYVDGNSWYWDFALRQVRRALLGKEAE